MSYTVLARKYRSSGFDQVVGQEPISRTLKNAISTGRIAHAYLFCGTRGIGKTTMARILAKALNCLSADAPTTEPCCKCDCCLAINEGQDIDVIEIDGASNRGIDNIRELIQNAIYRPTRSRFKIYIIDEVHMLTNEAFNALLKILEEPPDHVKFIFATTEPNKVIPTIQSRCQRFDFRNITPDAIADHMKAILKQEKLKFEDDFVLPLAKMANGSMRDGLSLLDRLISIGITPLTSKLLEDFLGCPDYDILCALVEKIGDSNAAEVLQSTDDLIAGGLSEIDLADELVSIMRDIMIIKAAGPDAKTLILTISQRQKLIDLAEKFDIAAVVYSITSLEKLRWPIKNSDCPRALLEALLIRLTLSEHFLNIDTLIKQLKNAQPAAVQKKKLNTDTPEPDSQSITTPSHDLSLPPNDIQKIQQNWQGVLGFLSEKLGNSTASLLKRTVPKTFEDNTLTLKFDASAKMQKKIFDTNGRTETLQKALAPVFNTDVSVKTVLGSGDYTEAGRNSTAKANLQDKKNEIASDPAVKTIIAELGAVITDIREIKKTNNKIQ